MHPAVTPTLDNPRGANPDIKCQQISGGDGFATLGDGTQTYMFSFGPLSGMADIVKALPGTGTAAEFNVNSEDNTDALFVGAPHNPDPMATPYAFNGAVGLVPDPDVGDINLHPECFAPTPLLDRPTYCTTGLDGHVDARPIMDVGVMNGSLPAPLMAIDEDDEFFLTLTNVGQVMRPDLFEQHTVHFHGYPNASAFFDGVPDASVAINIGCQLHLLLPGPGSRHLFLALPHHAARAPADGHGRPDLRAAAAEQSKRSLARRPECLRNSAAR